MDEFARFVPGALSSLGADGFGLSDTHRALRQHFRVDASSIVRRVLKQLVNGGALDGSVLTEAHKTCRPTGHTGDGANPRRRDPSGAHP